MKKIKKRSGKEQDFDFAKIERGIRSAYTSVDMGEDASIPEVIEDVKKNIEGLDKETYTYDNIQEMVEDVLINKAPSKVSKSYIRFRDRHKEIKSFVDKNIDFIYKYAVSDNTANSGTPDDNSNVGTKNIGVLNAEIHKPENILISRKMIKRKLKELYPDFDAEQYERDIENHIIYKHDESSFAGPIAPYTYSSKEVVNVKYNEQRLLIPFDALWDIVMEESVCVDETNNVYQKYPENLYVLDDNGNWTRITHLTKKQRYRDLVRVKTRTGEDLVVTDNHPMIIDKTNVDNTVEAIKSLGEKQYRVNNALKFNKTAEIDMSRCYLASEFDDHYCFNQNEQANNLCYRFVNTDNGLGYVIGLFIGGGNIIGNTVYFVQSDRKILLSLSGVIHSVLGISGKIFLRNTAYSLEVESGFLVWLLKDYFKISDNPKNKTVPFNVYDFTEEFAKGIISGLIDSVGEVNGSHISIGLQSRSAILQCTELLRQFEVKTNNMMILGNPTVWCLSFHMKESLQYGFNKLTLTDGRTVEETPDLSGETEIISVQSLSNSDSFVKDNEYIYDITTDTHTFALNNILVHNCCSISMYPFLNQGIKNLGGLSAAPKNLDSYCGMLVNLIFAVSSNFAGACLYKDQELFIKDSSGITKKIKVKDLFERYEGSSNIHRFSNYQGNWEYIDISEENLYTAEQERYVKINKLFRREYSDKIYNISTRDGYSCSTSKDHRFKAYFKGRELELKAEELKVLDTVQMSKDYSMYFDQNTTDYKRGWCIGILCGDGCLSKGDSVELSVNYNQEYLGETFNQYSKEVFGFELHKNNGNRCLNYRKWSKEFQDKIHEDIIGSRFDDKHIDIKDKSIDYLMGFLDGLFCADGSYSASRGITISLSNKDLSYNIYDIINNVLGISYKGPHVVVDKRGIRKDAYYQYIPSRVIKYLNKILKKKLVRKDVSEKVNDIEYKDKSAEIYHYGKNAQGGNNSSNHFMLAKSKDFPHKTEVIAKIETFDNDDKFVYEIETESHWYNCGGFITHNCAVPEALLYFTHFCKKEWGEDFWKRAEEVITASGAKRVKTIRSQIRQFFQQIVYSINQVSSGRNCQSPFTNFSYYDEAFFHGMFDGFAFPDGTKPDWESLNWVQREFMQWFNEERTKCMMTFPVESYAMVYKDGKFVDEESAKFVAQEYSRGHSFFTYISDTVDSLSSCCFDGDTRVMYSEPGKKEFKRCVSFKEAYERLGESAGQVFVFNPYTSTREWKDAKIVKTTCNEWYEFITEEENRGWRKFKVTPDHIFPVLRGELYVDIPAKNIRVGDKLLCDKAQLELSTEDFAGITEITIKEISKYEVNNEDCYCFEVLDDRDPYFVLSNGVISHNCRLKNKLQTKEFNFTNGNMGLETGSKSVISLNLSRIIQSWIRKTYSSLDTSKPMKEGFSIDYDSLKKYLINILERVYKYHTAYNEYLWEMYNSGLLPVYSAGFLSLNKQYLTIGLSGLNQAAEFLGLRCNDNESYKKFCQEIFGCVKEQNTAHKTKKLTFNTEQVPAESLAIKNYDWDKSDGYWTPSDTNLYASYVFKPNDPNVSMLEKIRLHGKEYIGDFLDGGSAAHLNIAHHLSEEQYWKLLNYAAEEGCQYLTWNCINSVCTECGHIEKEPFDTCPSCGSTKVDHYDRVIGYLTKIKNWSKGRQEEQKLRVYNNEKTDI